MAKDADRDDRSACFLPMRPHYYFVELDGCCLRLARVSRKHGSRKHSGAVDGITGQLQMRGHPCRQDLLVLQHPFEGGAVLASGNNPPNAMNTHLGTQ